MLIQGIAALFEKLGIQEMVDGSPRKPSYKGLDAGFFYRTEGRGGEKVK